MSSFTWGRLPSAMKIKHVVFFLMVIAVTAACQSQADTNNPPPASTNETPTPELIPIQVYFTDQERYNAGTPPFEAAVTRMVPGSANMAEIVLTEFFTGPTDEEMSLGLVAITSGFTGFSNLIIEDGIARIYLEGECASSGATYSVAQPVMVNLLQFPEVAYVKIYDQNGETEQPDSEGNSIPFCLEP